MIARAALFDGPGKPFRIVDAPVPPPGPGECVVRVMLATVCGSDLHTIAGKRAGATPCVLGHEAVGVVEAVGEGVKTVDGESVRIGDRVVWSVAVSCGLCFFCDRGLPQKCERLRKYGKEPHDGERGPSGCFASHVHLWSGTAICRVPDGVPNSVIAPAMCATATVAAVLRSGGPLGEGDTVLITGAGMLGLTAAAMCHPATVVIVDRDLERLTGAKRFGAARTLLHTGRVADTVDLTRFDLALELTGSNAMAELCVRHLRVGGTAVLAGAVYPTGNLALDHERIVKNCLTVRGVHNYAPQDLLAAVQFLAANHSRFPFAELVAPPVPLERIAETLVPSAYVRASIKP